jgi:transposase-like protein
MIKYFCKWLELVPLPYCNNGGSTFAFLDRVLNRFGALAKVIIDKSKWHGKFQKMCEKTLIDHHKTS